MLVDVKDPSNTWYQACILEVWHKDSAEYISTSNPIIISDASLVVADATATSEILPAFANNGAFLNNISDDMKDKMNIDEEEKTADDQENHTDVATMEICNDDLSPEKSRAVNVSDIDISMVVQVSDIPNLTDSGTTMLRIAYLGMPERYDEWISLDSIRIRQVNSYSFGRRGTQPIREEILFLSSQLPEKDEVHNQYVDTCKKCFIPSIYYEIIDDFVAANGLINVLSLFKNDGHSKAKIPLQSTISIIIAINHAHKAISKPDLSTFVTEFVEMSSRIILNINLSELREIQLEVLEQALVALENICYTYIGRNYEAGQLIEPIYFELAMILVNSPFLNKRLGGLKVLSDLLRRAQNYIDAPNGLKITKSTHANNVENISYKVMSILHFLKLDELCKKISDTDTIKNMFVGDLAHESLMTKSIDILKPMAQKGFLDFNVVNLIWDLGFNMRILVAMQALVEIIRCMDIESALSLLDGPVSAVDATNATVQVIDLVAVMGTRARDLVMLKKHWPIDNSEDFKIQAMKLHSKALLKLWDWCRADSTTTIASTCTNKIDSIFGIGISFSNACVDPDFPWQLQLERTIDILNSAMSSLREVKSILPSISVLKSFFMSWPESEVKDSTISYSAELPFQYPFRSNVSEYFNEKLKIIDTLTDALVLMKSKFNNDISIKNSEGEIETLAATFKEQKNQFLSFLHKLVRSSEKLLLSKDVISRIWNGLIMDAVIPGEADIAITFIRRLVIVPKLNDNKNSNAKHDIVCTKEDFKWTFTNLLCDDNFIKSKNYSSTAFECMERFFQRLNVDEGYMNELTSKQQFEIIKSPSSLVGIDVFFVIILTCASNNVAITAANFLMSLPQKLSRDMMEGELTSLRSTFLNNCIKELHIAKSNGKNYPLKRLLMLLKGTRFIIIFKSFITFIYRFDF